MRVIGRRENDLRDEQIVELTVRDPFAANYPLATHYEKKKMLAFKKEREQKCPEPVIELRRSDGVISPSDSLH